MYIPSDLFRAAVTDIMLVLLLYSMSTPKYLKKCVYIGITFGLVVINLSINTYFYLQNDYTSVARVDLIMLLVLAIALKPLFQETFAQWCFSFVTMLNIYAAVVIISYSLCDFFPNPYYAITLLRFLLFALVTFALGRYFLPIYREVLKRWNIYIPMLIGLFVNLVYFIFGKDVEQMLTEFMWPLLLLILLEVLIYVSIFYGMNIMARESALKVENLKIQNDSTLLQLSATSMAERLQMMETAIQKQNLASHDQRHFNSMLLELLEQGKSNDASRFLRRQTESIVLKNKSYCENPAVGAAISYYASLAEDKGIVTDFNLTIPSNLTIDSLELAMALSNLLENAIHGCELLPEKSKGHIRLVCRNVGRLAIEISNPCTADTVLDENSHPVSHKEGHGIGTKSLIAFAKKYDGELIYSIENCIFIVRLLV